MNRSKRWRLRNLDPRLQLDGLLPLPVGGETKRVTRRQRETKHRRKSPLSLQPSPRRWTTRPHYALTSIKAERVYWESKRLKTAALSVLWWPWERQIWWWGEGQLLGLSTHVSVLPSSSPELLVLSLDCSYFPTYFLLSFLFLTPPPPLCFCPVHLPQPLYFAPSHCHFLCVFDVCPDSFLSFPLISPMTLCCLAVG